MSLQELYQRMAWGKSAKETETVRPDRQQVDRIRQGFRGQNTVGGAEDCCGVKLDEGGAFLAKAVGIF